MRRLKKHQVSNCQECKRLGLQRRAVWREYGNFRAQMCEEHKHLIPPDPEDEHQSEAEYQIGKRYGIEL